MISFESYRCSICNEERYQKVIFIGGEFSYQCPCCNSIVLFYETLFPEFQQNFENESKWSRYVGTWSSYERKIIDIQSEKIANHFDFLCKVDRSSIQSLTFSINKLSSKIDKNCYFVGSCYHDHFQESLRGLYHTIGYSSEDTYNIVILPDTETYQTMLKDPTKFKEIDEVWKVPFKREYRWPYINSSKIAMVATSFDLAITQQLDHLEGIGLTISKRAGPIKNGVSVLKRLLESEKVQLRFNDNEKVTKHIAILIRSDDSDRAGLNTPEQFRQVWRLLGNYAYLATLVVTTDYELIKAKESGFRYIYLPTLSLQTQFYKEHCYAVVGVNGSCCNIPALYEIPIFAFVKNREFPDDFYCFARMASKYDPEQKPWYGGLEKANNIHEIKVPSKQLVEPFLYTKEFEDWFNKFVLIEEQPGFEELEKGFFDNCPKCNTKNYSRQIQLSGSDFFVIHYCLKCHTEYFSFRGLTSLSRRKTFTLDMKCKECERYSWGHSSETTCDPIIINVTYDNLKPSICFYCMKPSIADLYYMLPSLLYLSNRYKRTHNIVAIVPEVYGDLIPKDLVSQFVLVRQNPLSYHQSFFSPAHKSISKFLEKHNNSFTSNVPGTLPYPPEIYREFRRLIYKTVTVKTNDVVIFCRLVENRKWPNEETFRSLVTALEKQNVNYLFLVFPANDIVTLPGYYLEGRNVVVNPTIRQQLFLVGASRVCLTPHGASEVIPAVTNTSVIELETEPHWWKEKIPQPVRFGLDSKDCCILSALKLDDISVERIVKTIKEFL